MRRSAFGTTSIEEVTEIYLKGVGYFPDEDDGGDGKSRLTAAEWLGSDQDVDMEASDEELDRAAEIEKKTVSIDEVLVTGFQQAQKEKGAAETMVSKFQGAPVEQLVKGSEQKTAAPEGADAASFGRPVRAPRYARSPTGVRGLRTGEGEQGDAPRAVHRRARSVHRGRWVKRRGA